MSHQEIFELLPWYLNGTLKPDERLRVETHLRDCGECSREFEQVRALRETVVEAGNQTPEPSPFLFTRALARVEEYEREKARPRWWQFSPRLLRAVMLAQCLAILVLGGWLVRERGFLTATGPSAGSRIVLGFQDGVPEQAMRQVLLEIRGNIVSGPSALGLYTVQMPGQDAEALNRLLEKLRRNQRIIRVAAIAP